MKRLKRFKRDIDLKAYRQRSARTSDYEELIDEPVIIRDQDDKILLVYTRPTTDLTFAFEACDRVRYDNSARSGGLQTTSKIFGYTPRNPLRKDFCSATDLLRNQRSEHDLMVRLGKVVAAEYMKINPELYAEHLEQTQRIVPDFRFQQMAFTSGIINKNNPLKYHFDSGNFRKTWSGTVTFKRFTTGGHLALPEYNLGLFLRDSSLLFFDGQSILHGVTPIEGIGPQVRRYTIVFYSLQRLWNCEPLGSELDRIKRLRTERETNRPLPKVPTAQEKATWELKNAKQRSVKRPRKPKPV